jgi:endonuclease-3
MKEKLMNRARSIQKILNEYFPDPPISLRHHDAYTLLVAVVLSAHSSDAIVNRITPALFAKAATAAQMAQLTVDEIQMLIKPCGLSLRKSQALKGLSLILLEKHGGEVPQTFEALEALPGVGHKTASVVLSQAFNIPAFPVDTHIFRCAHRWQLSSAKTVAGVERDLKALFPMEDWIKLHLQMIHYARAYCPARNHQPLQCPICRSLKDLK